MRTIAVDDATFRLLAREAARLGTSRRGALRHLLGSETPPSVPPERAVELVDVVATVAGHTVKGQFTPSTCELRVLTRPWSGRTFCSPAAAADAVARYFAAGRPMPPLDAPVWRVAGTGHVLRAPTARRVPCAPARTA
jgi:hypothetical protein